MVAGRTTEPRSFAVTKTSGAATVTAPSGSFTEEDAGARITGTGIAAGTTILTVTSDTAATLSANATASNSATGTVVPDADTYGFRGWSPETDAESETYSVTANNANTATPDRITNTTTPVSQRTRG